MTTVTIEAVLAEQAKLNTMIAALQASATRALQLPETTIELQPGERYAGLALGANGLPSHHLVLLPGDASDVNWTDAAAWADDVGGELPTRQEQALLYANLKSEFEGAWYWSCQEHETNGSNAWSQVFYHGNQGSSIKSFKARARAVRRFAA